MAPDSATKPWLSMAPHTRPAASARKPVQAVQAADGDRYPTTRRPAPRPGNQLSLPLGAACWSLLAFILPCPALRGRFVDKASVGRPKMQGQALDAAGEIEGATEGFDGPWLKLFTALPVAPLGGGILPPVTAGLPALLAASPRPPAAPHRLPATGAGSAACSRPAPASRELHQWQRAW